MLTIYESFGKKYYKHIASLHEKNDDGKFRNTLRTSSFLFLLVSC